MLNRHCGTAWVVSKDNKLLMIKNRKVGIWLPPGGGIDDGEWPHDATLRELQEEIGVTCLEPIRVIPAGAPHTLTPNQMMIITDVVIGYHTIIHNFLWRYVGDGCDIRLDHSEIAGLDWVDLDPVLQQEDTADDVKFLASWIKQFL